MPFDPNGLFYQMALYISEHKNDPDKIIICNEGSSRSAKTWDTIHLIYTYCDHNRNKNKEIYVFRDTLTNCKDYTLKEFEKCFRVMGATLNVKNPQKPNISLFGNNIYFRGLVDEQSSEAAPSNFVFVNEMLDVDTYAMISGWLMRCSEIFVADWNPKFTDHWAYALQERKNCLFTHSTYKNNKHLPQSVINEIEGYDPDVEENVKRGTADRYRHQVYAKGLRASPEGQVFKDVIWEDSFPEDCDHISYGMDFGQSNETAIVKNGLKIVDGVPHLYSKKLFYMPTESSSIVIKVVRQLGIDKHIWCDNNMPGWIADMRASGISALATRKFDGSREYWINTIKRMVIHLVRDADYRKEQENFKYRVVDGIQLSETVKKHDHLWSACGYSCVGDFRQYLKIP